MRVPAPLGSGFLLTLIASVSSAVTMDWTPIGNSGNACDQQSQGCFGAVGYSYSIGTYEVTNAQYAEFLNAKAASDPLGLYDALMGSAAVHGSIGRSGTDGNYTYSPTAGRENMPVNFVSLFDAMRFANWLNNGQGSSDTETGAYTLLGGTPDPLNDLTVMRNAGATIFLPNEDEWYKAAYYNPATSAYFDYPAGSDTQTTCAIPDATANTANCNDAVGDLTVRSSYTGSASPYSTFDQGGNAYEWTETKIDVAGGRAVRGGSFDAAPSSLAASDRAVSGPGQIGSSTGFRLAMIPEPGTGLLVIAGLLGLAGWSRLRA